ncbi:HET-domain-containing protein [Daldinia caldariorum]|uniref:HET-domain-containing protein n=1 Tax=Daldinia caldariorum TaxID=326644 RepID=UPI002008DB9A|nr:HET-domain-containing protein [Daldinia caldariorum]KAI1467245.1 HET-domain-containing protein [Daldinia caldariorum]
MLRLRGKVETPKQFCTPQDKLKQPCELCTRIFSEDLYKNLKSSGEGEAEIQSSCEVLAMDIYHSVLNGCNMCTLLGNSVLTAAENEIPFQDERAFLLHIPWYQEKETTTTTSTESGISQGDHQRGSAYEYLMGFESSAEYGNSTQSQIQDEPQLTVQSLNCHAKINLTLSVMKSMYSTGFDLINIEIRAIPSENCAKPWLFIPPYGGTLWLELISDNALEVFSKEWKGLSASGEKWPRIARGWLQDCQRSHQCTVPSAFVPTRLIDVEDPRHPHLVETSSIEAEDYVTLSYVWGTKQNYVLTQETLPIMLDGLHIQSIPQTVAEAMEVTRQLGFRYIWIDALCIIQDSREDKINELPQMAKIYQYSAITIAAANSTGASESFLKPPHPPVFKVQPFQITIGRGVPEFPFINLSLGFREEEPTLKDPIDSRGWTLQEWALASRRLRFSSQGVQWTCNKLIADPSSLNEHRDPPLQISPDGYVQNYSGDASAIISTPWESTLSNKYAIDEAYKRREMSMTWIEIRSQYAQRSLTFPTDKLSAISAVAAMAAADNGMTYVAGLWKEALLVDLQWYYIFRSHPTNKLSRVAAAATQEHEDEDGFAAPSWSWASVKYDNGTLYPNQSKRWTTDRPWHFRILDCSTTLIDGSDFVFGPVKSGYLDVEGRVLDVEWQPWTEHTVALNKIALYEAPRGEGGEKSEERLGQAFLDFPTACLEKGLRFKCLIVTKADMVYNQVTPERYGDMICAHALLLLPRAEPNTYRRVGLCYLSEGGLWEETTLESIRIV